VRLGRLSSGVPAIVFGYPRHSGATDEGMTNWPPIFAYLIFGLRRVCLEWLLRPIKAADWRGPRAKLGVQVRIRRIQVRLDFVCLRSDPICTWLERQSRDPAFVYKRLGGRSRNPRRFSTHLTLERSITQSSLVRLDPIYATIVTPPSKPPHQYKVKQAGRRPFTFQGGRTWVNSRVPLLSSDRRRVRQVPNTLPRSKALRHGHCRGRTSSPVVREIRRSRRSLGGRGGCMWFGVVEREGSRRATRWIRWRNYTQGREAGRGSERDASPVFPDETRYFYGRSGFFNGRKLVFLMDKNLISFFTYHGSVTITSSSRIISRDLSNKIINCPRICKCI
jgi:hypothetical protein